MNNRVANFNKAYDAYYSVINSCIQPGYRILEVGGGAHPSISERTGLVYHVVDPDLDELSKLPADIVKKDGRVQDLPSEVKYDLIVSKMVLEHIPNPDEFHHKVRHLLSPNGRAIHFFACRHSLPAFVNRFIPERIGEFILRILKNRKLSDSPKYEAYYQRTKGHSKKQLNYFKDLGYTIEMYHSFVGHKYFNRIPILKQIEQLYTRLLLMLKMKSLATVALVVLSKK